MLIGIGIGLLAAVSVVLLVMRVGKYGAGNGRGVTWLATGFAAASFLAIIVANFATINYTMPLGWIVAVVGASVLAVALFFLTGTRVGWKRPAVLMLVGILIASYGVFALLMFTDLGGGAMQPLFRARAQQIAEAQGFTALFPAELEMDTGSGRPVDPLGGPQSDAEDAGLWMSYRNLRVEERKAEGVTDETALRSLVAPGARPIEGVTIADDATTTMLTVNGAPAIGVNFRNMSSEGPQGKTGEQSQPITLLIAVIDGTDVRLLSQGWEDWRSDGTSTPVAPQSFEELVAIAESMKPLP